MKKTFLIITLFITGVCFGQTNQSTEEFYENGRPKSTKTYKESNDLENSWKDLVKEITWNENGHKSYEVTYKEGEKDGLWTYWNENGQKEQEITFKDDEKDGLWTAWYENGQKIFEATFKDGDLISEKCWDEDGNERVCN